ncbi:MAG: hypothetical protein WC253_02090 [Sulfurovaceae bacterium]|nr:hypothetical protein [Sulfurovaceae bacterium]
MIEMTEEIEISEETIGMTEEIETIDNNSLEELSDKKDVLLKKYKDLSEPLSYAQNDFEKSLIEDKRALLAKEIKALAAQIQDIKEV